LTLSLWGEPEQVHVQQLLVGYHLHLGLLTG